MLQVLSEKNSDTGLSWARTGSGNDPISPKACISFGGTGRMPISNLSAFNARSDIS